MPTNNPYEKMRQNTIMTTPKEELTLLLYDGALKFLNQAIHVIEKENKPGGDGLIRAGALIIRVQDIIREFQITLDMKYEISHQFARMYAYIYQLLVDGNISKDVTKLKEARDLIREFRDMWKEAMTIAKTKPSK